MRFFFDTDDGERRIRDAVGIDLSGEAEAVEQAVALLRDLTHVRVAPGLARRFAVTVRTSDDAAVYTAALDLTVDALGAPARLT